MMVLVDLLNTSENDYGYKYFLLASGVDPKSVLCAFFKQGQCTKGDKCKFSHDLSIERKGEKRNIYEDKKGEGARNTFA